MLKKIEHYFIQLIHGKKGGPLGYLLKWILWIVSCGYRFLISCRNWAFDHGCFKQYYPPVPVVISVGNIVAGGTGKTPVTLMLAQEFYQDFIIAILSRGYRSKAENLPMPVILSYGKGPVHPAAYCGDEPYLLSQNLPKAHVIVGKNRRYSSKLAARAGAQLILLDDGMQHRRLARDYDVVVMDARDPFGKGHFLPRGYLREGLSSLERADLIVLNHVNGKEDFERVEKEIRRFSDAPLVGTRMEIEAILDLKGQPVVELKKAALFCAIAHPDYFNHTVSQLGVEIVDTISALDHLTFTLKNLIPFCEQAKAKGADWILCTEKDFVKLDKIALEGYPIAWLKMRLAIVEGKNHWDRFALKTKQQITRRL